MHDHGIYLTYPNHICNQPRQQCQSGVSVSGRRRRARLGQHLLRDPRVLDQIIEAVPDRPAPIIEVGPGDGALTERLAALERPLVAVEIDEAMVFRTRRRLARAGLGQVTTVLEQDVLDLDPQEALAAVARQTPYGLVGNLPYAITAPMFRKFLEDEPCRPDWMLVMIQQEVAQRITAEPGRLSLLGVSVQFYARAELLFTVERDAFAPPPQVRSAVVLLRLLDAPAVDVPSVERFFEVVRGGFRSPRKQLHNVLAQGVWLPPGGTDAWLAACDIDPTRRPGTLALDEWARLAWWRERHIAEYSGQCA